MSGEQWPSVCTAASPARFVPFILCMHARCTLHLKRLSDLSLCSETFVSAELGINDLLTNLISVLTGQSLATLTVFERQSR